MPDTAAVEVQGVHFQYEKSTPILCGADLQLERGRCVGLFGNNGAGKSTLARILRGTRTPQRGQVLVSGRPLMPRTVPTAAAVFVGFAAAAVLMEPVTQLIAKNKSLRLLRQIKEGGEAATVVGVGAMASVTVACIAGCLLLSMAINAFLCCRKLASHQRAVVYITSEDGACFKTMDDDLLLLDAITEFMPSSVARDRRREMAAGWLTEAGFRMYDADGNPVGTVDDYLADNGIRVHKLSGGQRHLVYVLRNLARPGKTAVVFDDVLTYLDQSAQAFVLAIIRRKCKEEKWAGLYISTEVSHLAQVAEEFYFCDQGKVFAGGKDLSSLTYAPARKYVSEYVALMSRGKRK